MLALETMINEKLEEEEMIKKEKNDHKRNQKRLHQKEMVCYNYSALVATTLIKHSFTFVQFFR